MPPFQTIIQKNLDYIENYQLSNGSFMSATSPHLNDFTSPTLHYQTTFTTSNILLCLNSANIHGADKIKKKGIDFLIKQKNEISSFNYWSSDSRNYLARPYPNDLDDTCAALAAIYQYDDSLLTGSDFANIVNLLVSNEISTGGPYRTWIVDDNAPDYWRDVDVIVNSTIGYFLACIGVRAAGIEKMIHEAVQNETFISRYYPNAKHFFYFVSRFYHAQKEMSEEFKDILTKKIFANIDTYGIGQNILEKAILLSSMTNLKIDHPLLTKLADNITEELENDGIKAYGFCIDPSIEGKRYYSGCSALTTALCVEALTKYMNKSIKPPDGDLIRHAHIQKLAKEDMGAIGSSLAIAATKQIAIISDPKITSLAYDIQKALIKKKIFISSKLIENISLANLYGWMAYTIYDGVSDKECVPQMIHCANFFTRKLIAIYDELDKDIPGTMALLENLLDTMDNANICEKEFPLLADNRNLFERSIGYALAPLTVLLYMGYSPDSKEGKNMRELFENYLVARQLHDDACDWENDLASGKINSVGKLILKRIKKENINPPISRLREIFHREIAAEVSLLIDSHIHSAVKKISKSQFFENTGFLSEELARLKTDAQALRANYNKTLDFLENYAKNAIPGTNPRKPLS